jgi:N6-adenosine-specific RNA methylase IME4
MLLKTPPGPYRRKPRVDSRLMVSYFPPGKSSLKWYVAAITDAWEHTVNNLISCGNLLIGAKEEHPGAFHKMVENKLPFGIRTAQILMRIASDPRIVRANHDSCDTGRPLLLPNHVGTLHELTRLDDATFKSALARGVIHPEMERKDARGLVLKTMAQQRLATAAKQNVGNDVSLWLADPPWPTTYEVPYKTMSISDIKNLRLGPNGRSSNDAKHPTVKRASAKCAAIGMWAVEELLHEGEEVLQAWGFDLLLPRIIWDKGSHVRPGRAALMQHEYLLVGVRGGAVPTWLPKSVITVPRSGLKNSQKPVEFHATLQKMFPLLINRVELFARRTPPTGWRGWGNQYPGDAPAKSRRAA